MAGILVTGGAGQLATALAEAGGARIRLVGRPGFDFARPETIDALFADPPALVVNAAAWTAVDAAETDPAGAAAANHDGPARLARLCEAAGIPLIHISTDYVFDGTKGAPYLETDPTSPTGVYGRTKRDGERAVLDACRRAIVLRTAWVYSATGKNFVRTMLTLGRTRDHLRVVADQQGCPTAASELARVVLAVADAALGDWRDDYAGIFHSCGDGAATWHGFAEAIFDAAAARGAPRPTVEPITTADYPTPARRPPDSRLDCTKLDQVFGLRQAPWTQTLPLIVTTLLQTEAQASPSPSGRGQG